MSGTLLRWMKRWSDGGARRTQQKILCEPPAGTHAPVTISVVIPTVGRTESLGNLLRSLKRQTEAPAEVIVVDQNENDLLGPILGTSSLTSLTRIRLREANASAARNAGFVVSSSSHVL